MNVFFDTNIILEYVFNISEISSSAYVKAVADTAFKDIEDSYQYQHALATGCKVLLTINMKDYKGVQNPAVAIMSPSQFCKSYLTGES